MCGPPDFGALETCIIRLASLSAAGLASYSAYRAVSLCHGLRAKREELKEAIPWDAPGSRPVAEGSSGHSKP